MNQTLHFERGIGRNVSKFVLFALILLVPAWLAADVADDLQRADELLGSDPASALELLQQLEPVTPTQRVRHAVLQARAQVFLGQTPQADETLLRVQALLEQVDSSAQSQWLRTLATVAFSLGEQERALNAGRRALELLDPEEQVSAYAESLAVALQVSLGAFEYSDALNYGAQLQELLANPALDAGVRRDAYMILGFLHQEFNELDQAREVYRAAAQQASEAGEILSEADARYALARLLTDDEQIDEAVEELDRLAGIYADSQDEFGQAMVTMERAHVALIQDDFLRAETLSTEAIQRLDRFSVPRLAGAAYFIRIEALLEMDRPAEASQILEQMLKAYADAPMPPQGHALEARVAAAMGDWRQAYQASRTQITAELKHMEERMSRASDQARARLDLAAERVRRVELEAELELRTLQIEAADRQTGWQRLALALAIIMLVLGVIVVLRLRRQGRQLSDLALRDSLTQLPNRRAFLLQARHLLQSTRSMNGPISLLMIDLDHFKAVNDRFGHDTGDQALVDFSEVLGSVARKADLPARLGGEEFGLLLPGTGRDGAMQVAERLLTALRESAPYAAGRVKTMSASIGVASMDSDGSLEGLIKQADQALYKAKRQGRAQAVFTA